MADLPPRVEPGEAGFDADRLSRLDRFLAGLVGDGRLPGVQLALSRGGRLAHLFSYGAADPEAQRTVADDTVWRIYSMTKPVVSVAALSLWEEGAFDLDDPIDRWLPAFARPMVYTGGPAARPMLRPATGPIRVWHLLTHTAGLTYGFHRIHVTDEIYRQAGFDVVMPRGEDLAGLIDLLGQLPLAFDPGTEWLYSMATDVLGRLLEVVSGQPLDALLADRVLEPLGMTDTSFWVPEERHHRVAALYALRPGADAPERFDLLGRAVLRRPRWLSGGGGLVSTVADYLRFTTMLLRGGQLDGARVLAPRTVGLMCRNHLPGGVDLQTAGRGDASETRHDGVGFGLGVATVLDPLGTRSPGSVGEVSWGGMAGTAFWADPAEDLSAVFMTQVMPSSAYPMLRQELRRFVYAALVDPRG